ncbi:MAG: response regulator [Planctomycetota bacterium]|nr:response regulator [Planctomycetota bacterium]
MSADETHTQHRPCILLVDDTNLVHAYLQRMLGPEGYEVSHARDGEAGLRAATETPPDVIITSIELPKLNGYDMCAQIKALPGMAELPILVLSSRTSGVDIDRCFDAGATDFLPKPFAKEVLLARLEKALSSGTDRRGTVLVVEDSAVQRAVIVGALQKEGFDVLAGAHGGEGLELAIEHWPDLVVTDSEMPVMNGRDLTREIRKHERLVDVPVLMLTAADTSVDRAKGEHAGVTAYITKPFVPDQVVVIVKKLIAEHRLVRERSAMHRYMSDSAAAAAAAVADSKGDVADVMRAEMKFATIFFTDIVGFTPMTERMEPHQLVGLLNEYFDAMAPLFKERGGNIDKLIGDAIMATFVADDDRDAAAAAVDTGLAMLRTLASFNEGREEPVRIRVGINSGEVIMGDIGSRLYRRDYTAIGDAVNVAARLESAAEHDSVLISAATYALVADRFDVEARGPIQVKGKSASITVYRVNGSRGG